MQNHSYSSENRRCCAVCGGRFGLIRHYWWRTALCSKKCVDRFNARREADQKWLRRLLASGAESETSPNGAHCRPCTQQPVD